MHTHLPIDDELQFRCDACGAACVIAPEQVRAFRDQRRGLVS